VEISTMMHKHKSRNRSRISFTLGQATAEVLESRRLLSATGSVTGTVYSDPNQTAVAAGNSPLAGRRVFVDEAGNGTYSVGDPTAVTNSSGVYEIDGLLPGTYTVREVVPDGWGQTAPALDGPQVTVTAGTSVDQDFGNLQLGTGGFVLPSGGFDFTAQSSAIQPDGKIVVVGYTGDTADADEQSVVARYFADGTPDLNFGTDGEVIESVANSQSEANDVLVEPDGKLVVVGAHDLDEKFTGFTNGYAERLNANGTDDPSFYILNELYDGDDLDEEGVVMLPDGTILTSSYSYEDNGTSMNAGSGSTTIIDYNDSNGTLVDSFGNFPGYTKLVFSDGVSNLTGTKAAVDPNSGAIYLPGSVEVDGGNWEFALDGYSPEGVYQSYLPVSFTYGDAYASRAVVQPDGDVVMVGYAEGPDGNNDFALARLIPDGGTFDLDPTFGTDGTELTDFGDGADDRATDVELLADGTILVAGTSDDGGNTSDLVEQYASDGTPLGGTISDGESDFGIQPGNPVLATFAPPIGSTTASADATPAGSQTAVPATRFDPFGFAPVYPPVEVGSKFVNEIDVESTAPTVTYASNTSSAITAPGSTAAEVLRVKYQDQVGIDLRSLGSGNLQVTMPNGSTELATYLGVETSGTTANLVGDYSVPAPAGGWGARDNGTYTVSLLANQVRNTVLPAAAVSHLGSFKVAIALPDTTPPTAALASAPAVNAAGQSSVQVQVTYSDATAVAAASLNAADLSVTGPTGAALSVTAASASTSANASSVTVTYTIAAPAGGFVAGGNGTYTITLVAGKVADTLGNAVAASTLGTFVVAIGAPSASLAAVAPVTSSASPISLTLTYTGSAASILTSTIDPADLTVTGPAGALVVTNVTTSTSANAQSVTATYAVAAPAGGFTAGDDGNYVVALVAGQVTDTAATAVPPTTLGSFAVNVAAPASYAAAVNLSVPITTVNSGNLVEVTATVASADGTTTAVPTGSVAFYYGTTLLGTEPLAGGVASYSTATLPDGTASVTAVYSGDSTFTTATSAATAVTVLTSAAGAPVLTPVVVAGPMPVALVAGSKTKFNYTVAVTNTGGAIERGTVQVNVYASTDQTLDGNDTLVIAPKFKVSIKAGKGGKLTAHVAGLPASLPAGTYYLLAQVVDAAGFAQSVSTAGTITVAAPFVKPTVTFVSGPKTGTAGRKVRGSAVIAITNTGNVAITGPVMITLYLTATGTVDSGSTTVTTITKKVNIPAGKTGKIGIGLGTLASTLSGTYQLAAVVTTTATTTGAPAVSATGIDPASIVITAAVV
jgi:uncharacterized delta-60 repeat protein